MAKLKMNTLLAQVEHAASTFKTGLSQQVSMFKGKQEMFKGLHKTYEPREGMPDDPSKQGTVRVVTTVTEQFDWLTNKTLRPYLKALFSIEATNSAGANKVELKVGDVSFGFVTALDLMRLKTILTDQTFLEMLRTIPVRSDSKVWKHTTNEEYKSREIFESIMSTGTAKTTMTEDIILRDPNLDPTHLPANYQSKITQKRTLVELGDYTMQEFTGEWNQYQKAEILNRVSKLTEAVLMALKEVNEHEVEDPNLNVDAFVGYLFNG